MYDIRNCPLTPYLQFKGSVLAAVQHPGPFSAAGWEYLCPLHKAHFCGSPAGIPQRRVGIQEENFILVTLKQKKNPRGHKQEGQRDFYRE